MTDYLDNILSDIDQYYPGSKRKVVKREPAAPAPKAEVNWDSRPYTKVMPGGVEVDFYTIGALADALGRPIITIRHWMKEGHLPQSPYRLPAKVDKHGELRQGRRLYTREMIEAAIKVFASAGLLEKSRVDWSVHQQVTIDIAEAWRQLLAKSNDTTN